MKKLKKHYACPVELALDLVGGKWKSVILARIKQGPRRYSDLRREIPNIADKELTAKLRKLEENGLIEKRSGGVDTVISVYALTRRAEGLRPVLDGLYNWGEAVARELELSVGRGDELSGE